MRISASKCGIKWPNARGEMKLMFFLFAPCIAPLDAGLLFALLRPV